MKYALVAINLPVKNIFRQFLYSIPAGLEHIGFGWRVVAPFGAQKVEGFIVAVYEEAGARDYLVWEQEAWGREDAGREKKTAAASLEAGTNRGKSGPEEVSGSGAKKPLDLAKLKPLICALGQQPWFDQEMLATAQWLAHYYMCSLAEAMRLFIPGKTSIRRQAVYGADGRLLAYDFAEKIKDKTVTAYRITEAGADALTTIDKKLKAQKAALEFLQKREEAVTLAEAEQAGISSSTLRTLAAKAWAQRGLLRILRNSYDVKAVRTETLNLTEEQRKAVAAVQEALDEGLAVTETSPWLPREFLLQGITGSGKTEVYLRATEYALKQGRQVLVLVPEIALTAQIVRRFQSWFGEAVAVAHSKLSQNERADVWYKMRTGEALVLIGVRSAVFAPFDRLGLVILDEEQEASYKQDERPNYHAREVARQRCLYAGAPLLLGSATPSLDSYYRACQGLITHLRLTRRPNGSRLPQVDIVDMREELAQKNFSVLSRLLRRELIATAAAGGQSIVLLNRRGYSTFVMCRDCGETLMCPHCAVSLVYHAVGSVMRCHYCGNEYPVPRECPKCHSKRIKFFGTGTQKAEAEVGELPLVKILRMDQDTTLRKMAHEEILARFAAGEANVLLGTQMVAKGHDIPNVTLVGILTADSILNLPDFRATERAFALMTQAAGRAGRGDKPGKVVLQTYDPENQVIQLAARQDYDTFARQELTHRQELWYPPYSAMLKVTVLDKSEMEVERLAGEIAAYLEKIQAVNGLTTTQVLGPFPALIPKVRDLYRVNIVIKSPDLDLIKEALLKSAYKTAKNVYFDVDPLNVL